MDQVTIIGGVNPSFKSLDIYVFILVFIELTPWWLPDGWPRFRPSVPVGRL